MIKSLRNKYESKPVNVTPTKMGRQATKRPKIELVTKHIENEPIAAIKSTIKQICPDDKHHCKAIMLTNLCITWVESLEKDMKAIGNHPNLSADTKADIQSYINKNIIRGIDVLSRSFDIMATYYRLKDFKSIHAKALRRSDPGLLEDIKHI